MCVCKCLGSHNANIRTRISEGIFLAMSFPREGYSANKFIARGGREYGNISHQLRGTLKFSRTITNPIVYR